MKTIDLCGEWRFKAVQAETFSNVKTEYPKNLEDFLKWMPCTVPGTVHTDLLALGKIEDPFYRMNENHLQWIDKLNWKYEREFYINTNLQEESYELVTEGLDTIADIFINDSLLAKTQNMFIEHRFEIKYLLKPGINKISILFHSAYLRSKKLWNDSTIKDLYDESFPRIFVRKSQYSFGWDWGPTFITSGIWKPIRIEAHPKEKIQSVSIRTIECNSENAKIEIAANCLNINDALLNIKITHKKFQMELLEKITSNFFIREFLIEDAKLWMPNGFGEQNLYNLEVNLLIDGELKDTFKSRFGIRIIELFQNQDEEGKEFIFKINGQKIFCKGANWIPNDSFLSRVPDTKIKKLLQMAKNSNINMLRVWGGGIYERDVFYNYCDELGILVWQDFMFACAYYPEDEWFNQEVIKEAIFIIRRLFNHPSLAIWCGNNECEWMWDLKTGTTSDKMPGIKIFNELLSLICSEQDPSRPYIQSSPFGGEKPNGELEGDHHQWDVWSGWKNWREYKNIKGKFISEFGFQAPANYKTLSKVLGKFDRSFQSQVMEHHNKQIYGMERLFAQLSAEFKLEGNFEELIYKLQLNQAEAIKFGVEHWRRRKFLTAGTLFWQWNDCWPVCSWSAIDYDLRPKALYYYAKNFFNPVLLSFEETGSKINIWVTNDLLSEIEGTFHFNHVKFDGKKFISDSFFVKIPANSSQIVFTFDTDTLDMKYKSDSLLLVELTMKNRKPVSNLLLFQRLKHYNFPKSKIEFKIIEKDRDCFTLEVYSKLFVKSLKIDHKKVDIYAEENYFDLLPQAKKAVKIYISEPISTKDFLKGLIFRRLK